MAADAFFILTAAASAGRNSRARSCRVAAAGLWSAATTWWRWTCGWP